MLRDEGGGNDCSGETELVMSFVVTPVYVVPYLLLAQLLISLLLCLWLIVVEILLWN